MYTPDFDHSSVFFFDHTPTTEIYTLSLHDALPISRTEQPSRTPYLRPHQEDHRHPEPHRDVDDLLEDRKSTRLNSSHTVISYAVFCLKKKKKVQCNLFYHTTHKTVGLAD